MHLLKTEGTEKAPGYIQIRDEAFALILHANLNNLERKINENLKLEHPTALIDLIKKMPAGKIEKYG